MKNKPSLVQREILERHLLTYQSCKSVDPGAVEAVARLIKEEAVSSIAEIDQLLNS